MNVTSLKRTVSAVSLEDPERGSGPRPEDDAPLPPGVGERPGLPAKHPQCDGGEKMETEMKK